MAYEGFINVVGELRRHSDGLLERGWVIGFERDRLEIQLDAAPMFSEGESISVVVQGIDRDAYFEAVSDRWDARAQIAYLRLIAPMRFRESARAPIVRVSATTASLQFDNGVVLHDLRVIEAGRTRIKLSLDFDAPVDAETSVMLPTADRTIVRFGRVRSSEPIDGGKAFEVDLDLRPTGRIDDARWQRFLESCASLGRAA